MTRGTSTDHARSASSRRRVCVAMAAALAVAMAGMGLGLSTPANAVTAASSPAVIGGSGITVAESPWQVLFIINTTTICSGSLLSPTQIVSAAHCFAGIDPRAVQAWAGISKVSERSARTALTIGSITNHADFNPQTYANDIALITLAKPVTGNLDPATIALPVQEDPATWPAAGREGVVSGWGEVTAGSPVASNQLQAAVVTVLSSPESNTCGQYGETYLPTMQVCAGDETGAVDACSGDSGGPLVFDGPSGPVLGGIVSTGLACARPGYPGLYVRVRSYLGWLAAQGVDVAKAGTYQFTTLPGSPTDGKPTAFAVGSTYPAADVIAFTKLPVKSSRITTVSGKACRKKGQSIRIVNPGKCTITVRHGKQRVPVVITVY